MNLNITALVRSDILKMQAFTSARSEKIAGEIFLDANENPWGNETGLNRYPEPQPEALINAFADLYEVAAEEILVTRGIDEGIDLLIRTFCRAYQDKILLCPPTYGMYEVAANIQGAQIVQVPLLIDQHFALDVKKIKASSEINPKLIFICSPNNPTGTAIATETILELCQFYMNKAMVIVDEAYVEFSANASLSQLIQDFPNLVVLRTLSKAYGLAGLRCGAVIANSEIVKILSKVIAPYPIVGMVQAVALGVIAQAEVIKQQLKIIKNEKQLIEAFLRGCGFVEKVWESQTNFILFKSPKAQSILDICMQNGIILRDRRKDFGLEDCLRVTVGSPSQNQFLLEVIKNA